MCTGIYSMCGGFETMVFFCFRLCSVTSLQAFAQSFASETEKIFVCMVPSPLPYSNALKQLWIHMPFVACVPRTGDGTFGNFPHSIDAACVHQQLTPWFCLFDTKDAFTVVASFMAYLMFGGEFGIAWCTSWYILIILEF